MSKEVIFTIHHSYIDTGKYKIELVPNRFVPEGKFYLVPPQVDFITILQLENEIKRLEISNENRLRGLRYWKGRYEQAK